MPDQKTRADALWEYLTGASVDGGTQSDPKLSLGNFRSSSEAQSLGITVGSPLTGVSVLLAGGANPVGTGQIQAIDSSTLAWAPAGGAYGLPVPFSGTQTRVLEAAGNAGQFLRVTGTTPFTPGTMTVTLAYVPDNVFGMNDVLAANAAAGISEYRATIVRNESANTVHAWQRWIGLLGTPQTSDLGVLGASGSGTLITSGDFSGWPDSGWVQVRSSSGTLKEVVYYNARTATKLLISATGRGLLGTTSVVGATTDVLNPVPGIALAMDPTGVVAAGSSIQTVGSVTTAPAGVSWNLGITAATGLQIGDVGVGEQIGLWIWRQTPAGAAASPQLLNKILDSFSAL